MLVDADKAKEKLAKVCEEENLARSWCGPHLATAIRQTDLTDCRVESPTWNEVGALHGQVESLSAQVAELKKDAERYQWLREKYSLPNWSLHTLQWTLNLRNPMPDENGIDAAIDQAIDAAKEGK